MATFDEPMAGKGETPMENAYLTFVDEQRKALVNWHNILVFRDWVETQFARIAELQSQLDAKWISVSERLPEANDEVWVWVEYHDQDDALGDTSWLQDDGTWAMGSAKNFTVTRWQPLPPPPSGAKGETKGPQLREAQCISKRYLQGETKP